jgi:hypothetical protein
MYITVNEQLAAAGGVSVSSVDDADVILLVNNFDTPQQLEASQQVCRLYWQDVKRGK